MGESKQLHLNGAYYGPTIPPPSKTYHRPGRGGGGCCCNPFTCCCGCLMNCICTCVCQIIITILVIVGIIAFVGWLVFRPNTVKFDASEASLTEFSLNNNNNTLHYNLALNLTIRNPNKRIGIYYDKIEARAFYQGQRFSTADLQPFYQGHKDTHYSNVVFRGQQVVLLGNREVSKYNSDKGAGAYDIEVKLYLRIRLKFRFVKSTRVKPKIDCDLRIPLRSNGTVSGTYEPKRCDFDWR